MVGRIEILRCFALSGMLLMVGCASRPTTPIAAPAILLTGVEKAAVVQAAEEILTGMRFTIEKSDAKAGIVRTRPHTSGQFFQLWQSDTATAFDAIEANLQTVRRSVEVRVDDEEGPVHVDCTVRAERLSLPGNEVASTAQAYRMHSGADRVVQTFELTPSQRAGMAWIDLGEDPALAAEILRRIEQGLEPQG